MRRLLMLSVLLALLFLLGCSSKDFWVQGPASVAIATPIGSVQVVLEDGAIYSSSAIREPETDTEPEPAPELEPPAGGP